MQSPLLEGRRLVYRTRFRAAGPATVTGRPAGARGVRGAACRGRRRRVDSRIIVVVLTHGNRSVRSALCPVGAGWETGSGRPPEVAAARVAFPRAGRGERARRDGSGPGPCAGGRERRPQLPTKCGRQILRLALRTASRTASRFGFCQPFSGPLGPCKSRMAFQSGGASPHTRGWSLQVVHVRGAETQNLAEQFGELGNERCDFGIGHNGYLQADRHGCKK